MNNEVAKWMWISTGVAVSIGFIFTRDPICILGFGFPFVVMTFSMF